MIKPIHIFLTFFLIMFLYAIALQSNRNNIIYNRLFMLEKENTQIKQYLYEQGLLHPAYF